MSLKEEFLDVVTNAIDVSDRLIEQAKSVRDIFLEDRLSLALRNFEGVRQRLLADDLPRSNGAGLGFTRELDEWGIHELLEAGSAIDEFYRLRWR